MSSKSKTIAISFSGGMDSVALALHNLEKGNNVELLRFEILNNWQKAILERKACEDLVEAFRSKYPSRRIELTTCGTIELLNSGLNLPQAAIWAFLLASTRNLENVDEVQVAYILNDCAVSYMSEIKKLYTSVQSFRSKKLPPLKFPFIKLHKTDINNMIPYDLRNLTVTCEQPIIENVEEKYYLEHRNSYGFRNTLRELQAKECGYCETCTKKKNMFGESTLFNNMPAVEKSMELVPAPPVEIEGELEIGQDVVEEPALEKNYSELLQ